MATAAAEFRKARSNMPDYALCREETCPKRLECARYLAIPDIYYQTYIQPDEVPCDLFWDISEGHPFAVYTKEEMIEREKE